MPDTKIATCCYCGRRTALQMSARGGHELACGSCGAPLHEMKWLKPPREDAAIKRSPPRPAPHGGPVERRPDSQDRRRKKRREPLWKKALEEVFDVIEDVFD